MLEEKIPYILLICNFIYLSQKHFPFLHILPAFCALLVLAISLYYLWKVILLKRRRPVLVNSLLLLVFSSVASLLIAPDLSLGTDLFKNIVIGNFSFFPIYYLSLRNKVSSVFVKTMFILFFSYFIYNYFSMRTLLTAKSVTGDIVNNVGYDLVSLLPLIIFFKKNGIKLFFLSIVSLLIIFSVKRGAIVTLFVGLIVFILYFRKEFSTRRHAKLYTAVIILSSFLAFYFLLNLMMQNEFLVERFTQLSEGNSSGRDVIFRNCWTGFWANDNVMRYLFGYGMSATWTFAGNYAHNDWLELLVDNGVVGVLFLLSFYIGGFSLCIRYRNSSYQYFFILALIILFSRTLFSMSFFEPMSFIGMTSIAFVIGNTTKAL